MQPTTPVQSKIRSNHSPLLTSRALFESLECRRLLYVPVPSEYSDLGTVYIRPKAATYTSDLTLTAGTTYLLRAQGEALTSSETYDGDIEFPANTTVTTWGVSTNVGTSTVSAASGWGTAEKDHVYDQSITPGTTGVLSFVWTNDATDAVSSLAVSVYVALPSIKVATIRTDVAVGSVDVSALPKGGITVPVNNADFDQNGVPDNQQSGRVVGDGFLVPIELPEISTSSIHNHYEIIAPRQFRVWLNADRTGSTVNVGIREKSDTVVYLEAKSALPRGTTADIKVITAYDGTFVEQDIPVTTFTFTGPTAATTGSTDAYGSNATVGSFDGAVNGRVETSTVGKTTQSANVLWSDTPVLGYVEFRVNSDFLWGLPVLVDA